MKFKSVQLILDNQKRLEERISNIENDIGQMRELLNKVADTTSDNSKKLYRFDWEPNQNIKQRLQDIATRESAEFILNEMNDGSVVPLNVTKDILDLGMKYVSIEGLYLEFGVYQGENY